MIDPADLLSTNKFISNQKITDKNLANKTYQNIPTRQDPNQTRNFLQNNVFQNAHVNRSKQQIRQWPPTNDKTTFPVLSNEIGDLSENRYSKYKSTYVSIDSREGIGKTTPDNALILNNCTSYDDGTIINNYPITNNVQCIPQTSNNDYKIFLREKFENVVSISLKQIDIPNPFYPNTFQWSYPISDNISSNSLAVIIDGNYTLPNTTITHSVTMSDGPYFIPDYLTALERKVNSVSHDSNEQYNSGKNHQMTFRLSEDQTSTIIVNRLERLHPMLVYTAITTDDDYIGNLSFNSTLTGNIDEYVYFVLSSPTNDFHDTVSDVLPIIWTDLPGIGGISFDLLNYEEFNYWNGGGTEPANYYFEYVDSVKLVSGGRDYRRYRMKIIVEDLSGIFNEIHPTHSEQMGQKYLLDYWNNNLGGSEGEFPMIVYENDPLPMVGRGYPLHLINNPESVLRMLGWGPDKDVFYNVFSVHKSNQIVFHASNNINKTLVNGVPGTFIRNDYMFLKLTIPSKESSIIGNTIIKAGFNRSNEAQDSNAKYINNVSDLFAKILFVNDGSEKSSFIGGCKKFINNTIDKLDELEILFIDKNGKIIDFGRNYHNMTLEIVEKIDVLKETQYDSKRGRPIITGFR
jgi:hypothetical protein